MGMYVYMNLHVKISHTQNITYIALRYSLSFSARIAFKLASFPDFPAPRCEQQREPSLVSRPLSDFILQLFFSTSAR